MADKPEYVDLISARTRQNWRRTPRPVLAESEPPEEGRLSHWPPARLQQWRMATLTPWKFKLKSWKLKDWL